MENVNPLNLTLESYMKKYNYTNLEFSRWRSEMMRTGVCIDFSEYLDKRDQVHKTFENITLGAPSNPQNTSYSKTYVPYEPSPRIVSYESDRDYEMVNVELPRCMLGLDFTKTYDKHEEPFRQMEHSDQVVGNDSYESDQEFEMGFEIPRCMLGVDFSKIHNKHIGDLDVMQDKAKNPSPLSTPQVTPSVEAYTASVTYPEEVDEIIGTPMEEEPLDHTQLEDIGVNTCSHNLSFSSKEVPSFDEPEPQPKPLPNFPSLDVNLGIEIGPDPPIKPFSPGSFTLKGVDSRPCTEEANIGVNHDLRYLHHPFVSDHKKHYGFKPGLSGQDGLLTRSLSKLIENDPFLGGNFSSPIDQMELGKVMMKGEHPFEHIIHPPLSPHEAYFHRDGVYRYYHPHLILSVGKTSPISVK